MVTKNKKGAMEMSMGTIVTIVLLMSMLVVGIFIIQKIRNSADESLTMIDDQLKNEITDLFGSSGQKLVVKLGSQNTVKIKQGTENFGIGIGFAPDNPNAWGTDNAGCTYAINPKSSGTYCEQAGWRTIPRDITTGTQDITFDQVERGNGYALIKLNVPSNIQPCNQRFTLTVKCIEFEEPSTSFFDVEIIKSGLF